MIEAAQRLADELLAPNAERVDQASLVPSTHFEALGDAGLFGIAGRPEHGGSALPAPAARRAMAAVAGGCGATFFVWVQHHSIVRTLTDTLDRTADPARRAELEALLTDLAAGRRIAGTAFAHLRRAGAPAIRATRVDGGWRLDGLAPWATSWGIAERFIVAAESADGAVVWSLIEAGPTRPLAGMTAEPLRLPVLGATGTVALRFDGCVIGDDHVVATDDAATWRRIDRVKASAGQPAPLGIAARCIGLLRGLGDDDALSAADRLAGQLDAAWAADDDVGRQLAALTTVMGEAGSRSAGGVTTDADDSIGAVIPSEAEVDAAVAVAAAHRTSALELARSAAGAHLAAVGGRGMDLDHPAQRLAREADFYVIQAQTADGRRSTLARI